jgi:hypothetical protein
MKSREELVRQLISEVVKDVLVELMGSPTKPVGKSDSGSDPSQKTKPGETLKSASSVPQKKNSEIHGTKLPIDKGKLMNKEADTKVATAEDNLKKTFQGMDNKEEAIAGVGAVVQSLDRKKVNPEEVVKGVEINLKKNANQVVTKK